MKWIFVVMLLFFVHQCVAMSASEIEDFTNFLQETSRLDQNLKSKNPEEDYDEEEPASDNAWEESGKFEGDLILNDRQRRMIVANVVEGLARNGLTDSTKRWPNNEVIYFIQREHFTSGQVQAIQDGIDDLARASCVKFTPYKKGDRDAVVIQGSRRGCFSQVGYQGGYQVLNLSGRHPVGRGCFRHGTVVHELLHTLGFYHMQSSPDRDDYIDVLWENIIQAARHNFRKYNSFAVSDFGVGYDYESVLHYSRKAFSANGQDTLVPKQSGAGIGQRVGLSDKDVQKLNKMYCDAESDLLLDNDSAGPAVVKKKNNKNKPFEGRGIGYHQGKAVAIHLPAAQTYDLHDISHIHILNDFSTKENDVPPMSIRGIGAIEEIDSGTHIIRNDMHISNIHKEDEQKYNENENLDELLHKFSSTLHNQMNPLDARKFDYNRGQNNENNISMDPRKPLYYFSSSEDDSHRDQRDKSKPSSETHSDVDLIYELDQKGKLYLENNKENPSYAFTDDHRYKDTPTNSNKPYPEELKVVPYSNSYRNNYIPLRDNIMYNGPHNILKESYFTHPQLIKSFDYPQSRTNKEQQQHRPYKQFNQAFYLDDR